ncbi:hypothetical protein [Falsiphaeobacter marinintestinus]|uniref:hypothetical protein n=1 Tax=Falsiphaeobacter marinintestinus TaxID=1492905 RepID=UPI001FE34D9C|nr:hypothetical protein [Phaeobacter marinintestinus]
MFEKILLVSLLSSGVVGDRFIATDAMVPVSSHLAAEPQTPMGKFTTATEVRPILSATKSSWVAVREYDGQDLLYVTHLFAWRCGLAELKVGVNGGLPQVWPLPPCHVNTASPNAITETDGLPYVRFPLGSVETIEVHVTYDDLGTDMALFDRTSVLMP